MVFVTTLARFSGSSLGFVSCLDSLAPASGAGGLFRRPQANFSLGEPERERSQLASRINSSRLASLTFNFSFKIFVLDWSISMISIHADGYDDGGTV